MRSKTWRSTRAPRMLSICQLGGNSIAGLEAMVTWGSGTRPIAFPPDTTRLSTTTCPRLGSEESSLGFPRSGSERALVAASRQNSNKLQDIEAESRLSLRGGRGAARLLHHATGSRLRIQLGIALAPCRQRKAGPSTERALHGPPVSFTYLLPVTRRIPPPGAKVTPAIECIAS